MELSEIYQKHCRPLDPISTGLKHSLPYQADIKAVIFDIYGTLFITGCGDISISSASQKEEVLRSILADFFDVRIKGNEFLTENLISVISREHRHSNEKGVLCPEVEVRDLWSEILNDYNLSSSEIEQLATHYEAMVNPTWPMPGLEATLSHLVQKEVKLGIISNAQFYTPYLFDSFLGKSVEELGFDPNLSLYSYQHLQAKPGVYLFQKLAEALEAKGILPHQTLYVGNDMRNDITPAHSVGFTSVLFAGDMRSLRGRAGENLPAPDAVVTELIQILDLF